MKRFLALTAVLILAFGCASAPDSHYLDFDIEMPGEMNWDDIGTELVITNTASALGYYIGSSGNTEIESMIALHYENIKAGKLDMVALNLGLDFISQGNMPPILSLLINNTLNAAGAIFVDGQLIELDIPPEIWEKAESAYSVGLALGKAQL